MEIQKPFPSSLSQEELYLSFYGCLENSDDGFLIVAPDGTIAYINEAYCNYIGIDRMKVIGEPVLNYIDTTELAEAATNPEYKTQTAVLHKVSEKQYRDGEHYCIVNRSNISVDGKSISGVGQIKFVRSTLKLSTEINKLFDELSYYKDEVSRLSAGQYSAQTIIGNSAPMQEVKMMVRSASINDFSVLLTGETGTGKEVVANAIHYSSKRRRKPFVRINCASIPAELLESELFGYVEGAFTGAKKGGKKGKFELATGGTLFLDEIGDMPLPMQAKILRALQEQEIEPVGSEKTVQIDVRVIAATNRNLEDEIKAKRFRADLFYRLNVISIELPPLRQRIGDIRLYVDDVLNQLNSSYHTDVSISFEACQLLEKYSWPGNVRELKNIVERCYVFQENGVIMAGTVSKALSSWKQDAVAEDISGKSLDMIMDEYERSVLLSAINANGGNLRKTAAALGIHRVTLYKKLEKHHISRGDFEAVES